MAQLTINRCKKCTRVLPAGTTVCPKCHTEHSIVPEVVNPLRFTPMQAEEMRKELEIQTRENPNDTNSLFGMGLVYLGMQNYELANQHFQKAVDQTPQNPDVYYYFALSLFAHRSPAMLTALEAERIEMWLQTAIRIQAKRKYLILEMLLLQGAFKGKGKAVPDGKPEPEELLEQALHTVQEEDELYEIEQHVVISDQRNSEFVAELRGERRHEAPTAMQSALKDRLQAYANLCNYPKGEADGESTEDGVQRLMDSAERKDFFLGLYEPEKPRYKDLPSYMGPIWYTIKKGVLWGIVWAIMLLCADGCWVEDRTLNPQIPAEVYVNQNFPDLKKKRKAEKILEVREDSIEKAQADSAFLEKYNIQGWEYKVKHTEKMKFTSAPSMSELQEVSRIDSLEYIKVHGIEKGSAIWWYYGFFVAAPLIWIILVVLRFRRCSRERRETEESNNATRRTYHEYLEKYKNRPTVEDYKRFCQLFIGPNAGLVTQGDVVSMALREAGISERDVTKGKVYLFNCFFDCTEDGVETKNPEVVLRNIGVNVAVAMPDQVLFMTAEWDTVEDKLPNFTQSSIMYSQIAMFQKTQDQIIIKSSAGVELAPITTNWGDLPSLFCYQSTVSSDMLTYSRTRTTDRNEFYKSLVDMHGRYNKQ